MNPERPRLVPPAMTTTTREESLRQLHEDHAAELWRFALRLTRDPATAEDVVQETLLRAWRDPKVLEQGGAGVRSWLYTVTRNIVIDRWRSAAARHELVGAETDEPAVADRTSEVLDRWLVADALKALSEEHRAVVAAAYYEGRSINDIAAALDIPPGTVKSRLHYGLRTLRLHLQERGVTRP